MTNPVVLYGTQSNGETLPVQVDEFGRLVAEGLQGSPGPEGPPGGAFPLPADPYEGALLGWLNGGLAWVSEPAVIIPEGLFGPILSYENGVVVVQGSVPPEVQNGVYLTQVTIDDEPFNPAWDQTQNWDDYMSSTGSVQSSWTWGFDGSLDTYCDSTGIIKLTFPSPITGVDSVRVYVGNNPTSLGINDNWSVGSNGTPGWITVPTSGASINLINMYNTSSMTLPTGFSAIDIGGRLLVSQNVSQTFRVNQVWDEKTLVGVPGPSDHLTPGAYLRMPEQKVAPWVYFKGRPEARMDHMQRLSGVVPPMDIDLLR